MAYYTLPVDSNSPSYTFQLPLESVTYTFGFYYNARSDLWTMDIMDVDGNPIIMGIVMLTGNDLIALHPQAGGPPGQFYVYDTQGTNADPHMGDLGTRHLLVYRESVTPDGE